MALTDKLSAIGDAIRAKTGKVEKLTLDQMPAEIAGISGGGGGGDAVLAPLTVTENGTYYPTYEAATVTWDENTEYDGTIDVDGIQMRYKKVENLTVPEDVSELDNPEYCFSVRFPDGAVQSFLLGDLSLGSADGVYMANDISFAVVWVKDATFVNAGYGASLEDNTVYVTDYLWLAHGDEYAGASLSLTAQGREIDGFSSVTVAVENSGGGAINGIIEQYKVNAGATVNAGDFVEFVQKWSASFVTEANPAIFKAVSLSYDTVAVIYVVKNAIRCAVLTLRENQFDRIFDGDIFRSEIRTFTAIDADVINATDIAIGYTATIVADGSTTYEGRCFVARFNDDYTQTTYGNLQDWASKTSALLVRSMTNERLAVVRTYETNSGYWVIAGIYFYDTTTLEIYSSLFSTTASQTLKTGSNVSNICVLDEFNFVYAYQVSSGRTRLQLITLSGNEIVGNKEVELDASGKRPVFARESEKSWLVVGSDIHRMTFVSGSWSVVKVHTGSAAPLSAFVANGQLFCLYAQTILAYSIKDFATYTAVRFSTIESGEILPDTANAQNSFVCVTRAANTLIRGFNIAEDGTITENENNTGLFVQKATTRRFPVGVAATGGAEGETVDVYVVG